MVKSRFSRIAPAGVAGTALVCLAAVALAGCSRNIDTPEAVKQGVLKDIAKKVDVQSMDVNVDSVSFREKEAEAQVSFKPKGAPSTQSIVMNYQLERQGDEWKIKGRTMQGHDQAHGQTTADAGAGAPGQPALPAGHPTVTPGQKAAPLSPDQQAGPLPAGHPTVPNQSSGATPK
jgi:hypothetical protein